MYLYNVHLPTVLIVMLSVFSVSYQQYSDSKSYCEDLTEGKFSFPVIHAIMTHPDDQQVISILLITAIPNRLFCLSSSMYICMLFNVKIEIILQVAISCHVP